MATQEKYPCYISIQDDVTGVSVELPSEKDGTMLLSTIASQFPGAIGLRFKSETGSLRGVRLSEDNVFDIPLDGWGSVDYQIVMPGRAVPTGTKRKMQDISIHNKAATMEEAEEEEEEEDEEELSPLEKMKKMTEAEILSDLIIMNVPYESNDADVKTHFETFGELDFCELKTGKEAPKHRGFGFIRYKTVDAVEKCLSATHVLHERKVDVCFPKDKSKDDGTPNKLFIGRLPKDITEPEMQEYFEKFGDLKECYIPSPFKGFGFVSFKKQSAAKKVLKSTHCLKGQYLNVGHPASNKKKDSNRDGGNNSGQWNTGFGGGFGGGGRGGGLNSGGGFGGRGGGFNGGGGFGGRGGGFNGGGGPGFGGMGGTMMDAMQAMFSGGGMAQRGGPRGANGFQNNRNFGGNNYGSNRR